MTVDIVLVGLGVACGIALVHEFGAEGRSILGWACIVGFGVLLFARL